MSFKSIYRIPVEVKDFQELMLSGKPISVAADRAGRSDMFDLWYENDPDNVPMTRGLHVFGTGHPLPWNRFTRVDYVFLGTVVTPADLVWHVYLGPAPRNFVSSERVQSEIVAGGPGS